MDNIKAKYLILAVFAIILAFSIAAHAQWIPPGQIINTAPTERAIWLKGGTYTVSWTAQGYPATSGKGMDIEIQKGAIVLKAYAYPNTGSAQVTVPSDLEDGNDYRINVVQAYTSTVGWIGQSPYIGILSSSPPAPTLTEANPALGQQGYVMFHTLFGTNFDYVTSIHVSGTGVNATIYTGDARTSTRLPVLISVAGDAAPGIRQMSLVNSDGTVGNSIPFEVVGIDSCARLSEMTDARMGTPYSNSVIDPTSRCYAVYTRIDSGAMPPGMTIDPYASNNGVISGTPTQTGTYGFNVQFYTWNNLVTTQAFYYRFYIIVVQPSGPCTFSMSPTSLADGIPGRTYSQQFTASGPNCRAPFVWSATGLPSGLSINANNGALTGTPATVGNYSVAVTVKDNAAENPFSAQMQLNILPDTVKPTSTIISPSGQEIATVPIWGIANDDRKIMNVDVYIFNKITGKYFDGSTFSSSTIVWLPTTLTTPGSTSTSWSYTSSVPWTNTYSYTVGSRAFDGTNYESPVRTSDFTFYLTAPDTTPPSQVTGLTALPISISQINLAWNAATDNVGVAGYYIYRCSGAGCTPTFYTATSSLSYSDTGLLPGTTYRYAIAAYDAAGNTGSQSTIATATTLTPADTIPPARSAGAPTGTVNVSTVTMSLTTDEAATCKYSTTTGTAYGAMISTFTVTGGTAHSKILTGLADASYNYYVRCIDIAGNANTNDYAIAFTVSVFPGSNVTNSTVTNSTITNSTVTNSTITNSTITNSTITNSTVTNSTVTNSTVTNSTITNSTVTNSTITNSTVTNTTVTNSTVTNSTITNSTVTQTNSTGSNITNSIIDNSVIINSTITNSTIINSTIISSTITNSTIINSNVTGSTIINTVINGANVTGAVIINGTIYSGVITVGNITYNATASGPANLTALVNYGPAAVLVVPAAANLNQTILANGSGSTDPNIPGPLNDSLTYFFDFNDGTNYTESNPAADGTYDGATTHTYSTAGTYTISLTVTDRFGASSIAAASISISSNVVSGSNVTNSTVTNSTIVNSTVTNSTVNTSTVTNSTITNSTIIASNITQSNVTDSNVTGSNVTGSNVTGSNVTSSTVTNSTVTNSTVTNSTVTGSTVTNSTVTNSTVTNSTVDNSTVTGSTLTNSTVTSSTISNSTITNSTITNSTVDGSNVTNSNVTGSTVTNSTVADSTVTNSTVTNSTVVNSTITNSNATDSVITNSTIDNSTVVNSTITGSTIVNSTITNSTVVNSTVTDSSVTDSTLINSSITNSTITNSTISNANVSDAIIINGTIYSGTITVNGITYNATASGPANLTNIIEYPPAASLSVPVSALVGATVTTDGSGSTDPNIPGPLNDSLTYFFDFNDGSNYTENATNAPDGLYNGITTHAYSTAGTYTISLTVTDKFGLSSLATGTIVITTPAPPSPPSGGGGGSYTTAGGGNLNKCLLDYKLSAPESMDAVADTSILIPVTFSTNGTCTASSGTVHAIVPAGWGSSTESMPALGSRDSATVNVNVTIPEDAVSSNIVFTMDAYAGNLNTSTYVNVNIIITLNATAPATNETGTGAVTNETSTNETGITGAVTNETGNATAQLTGIISGITGFVAANPAAAGGIIILVIVSVIYLFLRFLKS